ncbi:MAG: hypothetical protein Q9M37_06690 [Desulfonauticus sp.]|nr:hypothetical protein [Desulfonauticus sp.]
MFFKKLFNKKTKEKIEQYQEAITFAEAGDTKEVVNILHPEGKQSNSKPVLLVIGNKANFSPDLINYSVEMAKRMNYKILALNSLPLTEHGMPVKESAKKELVKSFTEKSKQAFAQFAKEAQKHGLDIEHLVMFKDKEEAMYELKEKHIPIEFVISDQERDFIAAQNRQVNTPRVCVYSLT